MQGDYKLLIQKLNAFIREYYKNMMIRGAIYSLITLICTLIIFAVIEHFGFFNSHARTILFWVYCGISISIIIPLVIRPAIQMMQLADSLTHETAAQIIGDHFPEVADKLLNILELKNNTLGNQGLIEASVAQKSKQIKLTKFNKAIDWEKTIYYSRFLAIPLIIIICFILSGNKEVISDSTMRIINYNSEFIKPAPFYFRITNPSVCAVEKEKHTVFVEIYGDERPQEAYINYKTKKKKLKKISDSKYSYTFPSIRENMSFFLSADEEKSQEHKLCILKKPEVENLTITVTPPKHTGMKKQVFQNIGSITIPEGSLVEWEVGTHNSDSLQLRINKATQLFSSASNNLFYFKKKINKSSPYYISLANTKVSFVDTIFYNIKVVHDTPPLISIKNSDELNTMAPFITGHIQDDYGFFDLQLFTSIYSDQGDTLISEDVSIKLNQRNQSFMHPVSKWLNQIEESEAINFYFVVRDNDKENGYKATQSQIISFKPATYQETIQEYETINTDAKTHLQNELSILEELRQELTAFEEALISKDSLDWRDRKKLEDILKQQESTNKKIQDLKNTTRNNFEKLNAHFQPSEEILKKQQELEKLFEEIIPEEIKDLYEELNRLKQELNKEDLQKNLKKLQLSNDDLEKELDRNLEVLKDIEFEQRLESVIDQLKQLSNKQLASSKENEDLVTKTKKQIEQSKKFEELKKEIAALKSLNKNLENKRSIENTDLKEKEISDEFQNSKENLEKGNQKKASKSQQKTGEKLKDLASLFEQMQQNNQESQNYEDLNVLRQILENLIYFSIEEENIFLAFADLHKDDPLYVDLMHQQQELREASTIIEDSLFALSKRLPSISSKVNREIRAIDSKTESAINNLRERLTVKAVQDQQFVMTSANNLAVMLFSILENMQKEMASDLPSSQQCEKPGKGKPKPGDLKRMQKELQAHLEKMKKQCEKNGKNQLDGSMSKQLVEMLAKQELVRSSLEKLREDMDSKSGLKSLDNAIKNMEQIEQDIANKNITLESLQRQKQILTKLLEVEDAMREQEQDDKRESKTAQTQYEKILQETYEKYELEKLQQTEMIKTTPPSLKNYYKEKVDRYFNAILKK